MVMLQKNQLDLVFSALADPTRRGMLERLAEGETNVGELAARYGGGGHEGAGSIPLIDDPDQQIQMIVAELKAYG